MANVDGAGFTTIEARDLDIEHEVQRMELENDAFRRCLKGQTLESVDRSGLQVVKESDMMFGFPLMLAI